MQTKTVEIDGLLITHRKPSDAKLIDVIADSDFRRSMFFASELGRQYWEAVSDGKEKADVDIFSLLRAASEEDAGLYRRLGTWGIAETLDLIDSVSGDPDLPADKEALDIYLIRHRKDTLRALRDRIFNGDKPSSGTGTAYEARQVASVQAQPGKRKGRSRTGTRL